MFSKNKNTKTKQNGIATSNYSVTWWRHQMEIFVALLTLCAGNSPATDEFHTQRPMTRSFDVFFDLRLNKHLSKQSLGWWFETPSRSLWRHGNDQPCCSVRANNTENFNIPLYWTLGRGTHQPSVDSPHKGPSVRKQDGMRQRFPSRDLALMVINVKRYFMGLYHHALSQCSFRQKWMPPLYQRN